MELSEGGAAGAGPDTQRGGGRGQWNRSGWPREFLTTRNPEDRGQLGQLHWTSQVTLGRSWEASPQPLCWVRRPNFLQNSEAHGNHGRGWPGRRGPRDRQLSLEFSRTGPAPLGPLPCTLKRDYRSPERQGLERSHLPHPASLPRDPLVTPRLFYRGN